MCARRKELRKNVLLNGNSNKQNRNEEEEENKNSKSKSNSNKTPKELAHTLIDRIVLAWFFSLARGKYQINISEINVEKHARSTHLTNRGGWCWGLFESSHIKYKKEKKRTEKKRKMQQHKSKTIILDNKMS